MGLAENLRLRLEELGISQTDLARRVGITQGSIGSLLSGRSQGSKHLHRIAKVLGTTPEKLTGEYPDLPPSALQDRRLGFRGAELDHDPGQVTIEHIDLRFGMGGTYVDNPVESTPRRFPLAWLRSFTKAAPQHLVWTEGDGDSMMPTIMSGDPILIDRSQTVPTMGDGIWAFVFGEVGMIKRLRPLPDGNFEIHSDNQLVRTALATADEIKVIGRVVAKVGRL